MTQLRGWAGPCACLALAGCGGGLPLLYPAQTLARGEVRAAAGFSANVAPGGFADAIRAATEEAAANPNGPGPAGTDVAYAKGALVVASVAPGLAPLVAARVGVGGRVEGGLEYTGRAVRVDIRRSFDLSSHWSLSPGIGAAAALFGRQVGQTLPGVDLGQLHGWGADVPLVVGYASDGDLYLVWMGGRVGWEHVDISQVRSGPTTMVSAPPASLSATRSWGGALLGLAVGFRHVHVAMEIDVSYASVSGDYRGAHAVVGGLSLAPAGCVWLQF